MAAASPNTVDRISRLAEQAWGRIAEGLYQLDRDVAASSAFEEIREARACAIEELRFEHAEHARVDVLSVHPSWILRALRAETSAVQRVVVAHAPAEIARTLRDGLGLVEDDLLLDRPAHPRAVAIALSLWSERLLGGPSVRPAEPSVVDAVAGTGRVERRRLFHLIGLAKWAYGSQTLPEPARSKDTARFDHFRTLWAEPDPRLLHLSRLDLRAASEPDLIPARLALISIGRLLSEVEPARGRWVAQHLPYDAARWSRLHANLENPFVDRQTILTWEGAILSAAIDRLVVEDELEPEPEREPGGRS